MSVNNTAATRSAGAATPNFVQNTVARTRIASLDFLKFIALCAVIGIHAPDAITHQALVWQVLNQLFRFGVPCFFLIAGFLFMRSYESSLDKDRVILKYGQRIIIPFLLWSLFYAVAPPFISGAPEGALVAINQHLWAIVRYPHSFLLTGFAYHLWFLSSLGQALLILWFCLRILDLRAALLAGAGLYSIALLGGPYAQTFIGFHSHFNLRNGPFFSALFVAIGAWLAKRGFRCSSRDAVMVLCAGLLLHASEVYFLYFRYGQPIRNHDFVCGTVPFAVGAMLWALSLPDFAGPFGLARLGTYSLGIYAIHPYVIEVLQGWFSSEALMCPPAVFESLVLVSSICFALCISRIKWARPVVV